MDQIIRRPAPFVLVSTGHGTVIVNTNDYRLTETGGYGVGFQLLNTSFFDPEEVSMAVQLLNIRREFYGDDVVALDCGANLGVHTLEWARAMYGWGHVLAFEAQERIYYALAGNIAINNCFNAFAMHAAVGAHGGHLQIPAPDYLKPASFGSLELKWRPQTEFIGQDISYAPDNMVQVRQVAIDELNLMRVDFIKLDIEGMELEAISGARQTIERFKPIMIIEAIKADVEVLTATVREMGYTLFDGGLNILAVHESDPCLARLNAAP